MARPLRLEFAGALYHVTARGNERRDIFLGNLDDDRAVFLVKLGQVCERFNWICHAYCLMTNHYHLLIETPDANLSKGMRQLNGVYTQHVNRTHGRVGHLFQGRYQGILVEKDGYLLELARYVVLNPVRAGMVNRPEAWPWSSYRATVGDIEPPAFLATDWLLRAFGDDRQQAVNGYRKLVADGMTAPSPWRNLKNQVYLGSERFVEQLQARIDPSRSLGEVPQRQRRTVERPLDYYSAYYAERDRAIAEAYRTGAYSMQAIAEYFGIGRMTVSRAVKRYETDHTS
ncbi:MAG: transposase [Candidatus Competibacteraceae bacterium]